MENKKEIIKETLNVQAFLRAKDISIRSIERILRLSSGTLKVKDGHLPYKHFDNIINVLKMVHDYDRVKVNNRNSTYFNTFTINYI